MISKKPPFKGNSMRELYKKVITAKYQPLKPMAGYPLELYALIKMILNPNPRLRPSCFTLLNQQVLQFSAPKTVEEQVPQNGPTDLIKTI